MYGLIYFLLQKYVQRKVGPQGWDQALKAAGLEKETFHPNMAYPDEPIFKLVYCLSKKTKIPANDLLTDFGKAIAPDLLALNPGLIKSTWKTLDLIENTDQVIHALVRQERKGANPPSIQCVRLSPTELQMIYASSRKLCSLAKGLCEGAAETFGEELEINETSCMHQGAPFCLMNIKVKPKTVVSWETPFSGKLLESQEMQSSPEESWEMDQLQNFFDPPREASEMARLGNYSIRKLIGVGGMGLVFEVVDLDSKEFRALKLIRPEMLISENHRVRFLREARFLEELESPCIVRVFQIGSYRGLPYLVMPLLKGCTLEAWPANAKPVTLGFLHMLGQHIGNGLQTAHARKLIHRDIKPANVWIAEDLNSAQIMDFGLVLDLNERHRLSQVGILMGTIHYMSPEQMCDGKLSGQSDLYSLGIILYQMVTGKLPFGYLPFLMLIKKVMTEGPVPPSQSNPLVDAEISGVILKLLDGDLGNRTKDAATFLQEWEEAFVPVSSSDPDWAQRVVFHGPFEGSPDQRTAPFTTDEITQ